MLLLGVVLCKDCTAKLRKTLSNKKVTVAYRDNYDRTFSFLQKPATA